MSGARGSRRAAAAVLGAALLASAAACSSSSGAGVAERGVAPTTTAAEAAEAAEAPTAGPVVPGLRAAPEGWPGELALGSSDQPGGAADLAASAPFAFRSQYLAGGVLTGSGWYGWQPDGGFVREGILESRAAGMVPVFDLYMIRQSAPGGSMDEPEGVLANLRDRTTMAAWFEDLRRFYEVAAAEGGLVVLHVEPDLWGYLHQEADGDDPSTVRVEVASTGVPELAGLPDTAAGFAQAVVALRDRYAPEVDLGYHLSPWAVGGDVRYSNGGEAEAELLGERSGAFYRGLGASFDVNFTDVSDRDAGFQQAQYGAGDEVWWDAADYRRSAALIRGFTRTSGLRTVIWQIPLGNTRMRAVDGTWNHYQDVHVETLLDDPDRSVLRDYVRAGVVALIFGRGADGATCACDGNGDGVTDPEPVNGNDRRSLSADDDGGFFDERAGAYYAEGPLPLAQPA